MTAISEMHWLLGGTGRHIRQSGGYPWTVIPVEKRDEYMDSLEAGSVKQDIVSFADFLGGFVERRLVGC